MPVGIIGYSAYLSAYRMQREAVAVAWQNRPQVGMKVCARFDEDSLTMAATAAADCLASLGAEHRASTNALFFCSTTAPYLERSNSAVVAATCDLPPDLLAVDFAGSLRAGSTAIAAALDRVRVHRGVALVCAADAREAEPGSPEELIFSDAGAAIAVGDSGVIAELIAQAGCYDDFFETTRRDRDLVVNSFEGKFSLERGYLASVEKALATALSRGGRSASEISRLVVSSPDKRAYQQLARKMGFADAQLQDIFWDSLGVCGCPAPLLLLSAALERARPGELVLAAGYGNGADAFLFRATDAIADYRPRVPLSGQMGSGICYPSYTLYSKAREYRRTHDDGLEITNVFYAKEETQNVRLHGSQCGHCGQRHFPQTRVCARCRASDSINEVALERTGNVFTFAVDHLAASPFPPVIMAVVDLDGGGRIYCELVDVPADQVRIGMPVELTLRRLREGGGLHHYYWKSRPRRVQ